MRRHDDFVVTTRRGRRSRAGALVVHHQPARAVKPAGSAPPAGSPSASGAEAPALVGFVVARSVGGSVVRHAVTRRLREQTREVVLPLLPAGSRTVVRALPSAATASSVALSNDLAAAWKTLARRA